MEFEFDKEIDTLLRLEQKGRSVSAALNPLSPHLDADEIAAFADHALPEKAKRRGAAHLADCDSCRKILSNVILLNAAESANENVPAPKIAVAAPKISRYKRMFGVPNLVYVMGALLILFGGLIGFIAVRNLQNFQVAEISQVSEKSLPAGAIPSESNVATPESSAAGTANINAATVVPNAAPKNAVNNAETNSNISVAAKPSDSLNPVPKSELSRENNLLAANQKNEQFSVNGQVKESDNENFAVTAGRRNDRSNTLSALAPTVDEQTADNNAAGENQPKPETSVSNRQIAELPVNGRRLSELQIKSRAVADAPLKKTPADEKSNGETTSVGGKKFNRRDNIWYDADYQGETTSRITRGTKQYKKLDRDLRLIAENLGGTVVVIWKGKAYRIQ